MEVDNLAERILLDLQNIFKKNNYIDEFDILPVHESLRNKCPVIREGTKLALEDWCVKHVYNHAYSKFFAWKKKPFRVETDTFLIWTCAILLINPEIDTVWNARKKLICQNLLKFEDDLRFSEIVLSRKPKSAPTFTHRKWVLSELKKSKPCQSLEQVIYAEMRICDITANRYPSNYYAWAHRQWVVQEMADLNPQLVCWECKTIESRAWNSVSDHSLFRYRQFLLLCYKNSEIPVSARLAPCPICSPVPDTTKNDNSNSFATELRAELHLLHRVHYAYPGHEALWYHRRYVLHEIKALGGIEGETCPALRTSHFDSSLSSKRLKFEPDCKIWCEKGEQEFLNQLLQEAGGNRREMTLIERHAKWLDKVLNWKVF